MLILNSSEGLPPLFSPPLGKGSCQKEVLIAVSAVTRPNCEWIEMTEANMCHWPGIILILHAPAILENGNCTIHFTIILKYVLKIK